MTKFEIAQSINGFKDLGRIITVNGELDFVVGQIYDNQNTAESWTDRDNSKVAFEPMTNGTMYVLHCNQVPCHVVDYENEDECLDLGALGCEDEAECLVLPTTKMIVTYVSTENDYEEMGYYLVKMEVAERVESGFGIGCSTHGGYRPGSGRKPTGRTRRTFQLTDTEYAKLKELLEQIRATK